MKKELINTIEQGMLGILNNEQLAKLHEVLELSFTMFAENRGDSQQSNDELLKLFLSAKQVEGCSERSLKYYRTTLSKMIVKIDKSVRQVETNDIRAYIADYENESNAGKVTLDNIRRNISSFFAWLEDENYIVKSPARRIHKIRVSIQTNSLHGGMAFSIASSQDSFPVMGFCVYPRFSNNLSNKCPKSTQNTPVCNKTH